MAVREDKKPASSGKSEITKNTKISFAKLLAANDKKLRDTGLKKLKSWLTVRSKGNFVFNEEFFMEIWTGLHYSMWMSDMPLVQEALAESISSLIHCFQSNVDAALLFIKCFCKTIGGSWTGLDQHRTDKFAMFVRRFLRQSLVWLRGTQWSLDNVGRLMDTYHEHILGEKVSLGFKLHFIEIFPEELVKVSKGQLMSSVVVKIVKPFARTAALTGDGRVRTQCGQFFEFLIKQTDEAFKFEEKFEAWRRAGFPGGDVNQMVLDSEDDENFSGDDENGEPAADGPLDPRAAKVDVYLPQVPVPAKLLARLMKKLSILPQASVKGKKFMLLLHSRFKTLAKGKYPLATGKVINEETFNLKKIVEATCKREIRAERKRREKRKKFKKKKSKSGQAKSSETKEHVEEQEEKRASENADRRKVVKAKKRKAAFVATPVVEDGKISGEIDLPLGWIVESCEEEPLPVKKRATESESLDKAHDEPALEIQKRESTCVGATPKRSIAKENQNAGENSSELNPSTPEKVEEKVTEAKKSPPKTPAFFSHAVAKLNKSINKKKTPPKTADDLNAISENLNDSKSKRRISFNLAKNMAQENVDYFKQLVSSPEIPYDGSKTPRQSALKKGLMPSPINPFYAKKLGFFKS